MSLTLIIVLSVFTIVSCENFLEGSNLQEEVEKYITIANAEKPALVSHTPEYKDEGVFKNIGITLTLSHNIEEKNFRFTNDELISAGVLKTDGTLNEGYSILKDSANKTYAYTYQTQTFFKNVKITDSSDKSLCSIFKAPVVSYSKTKKETIIQIPVDEYAVPEFTGLLDINVTFSKNIEDSEEIPILTDISWRYLVKNAFEKEKPELYTDMVEAAASKASLSENESLRNASYADSYKDWFVPPKDKGLLSLKEDVIPPKRTVFFQGEIPALNAENNNQDLRHFFLINHIKDSAYFEIKGYDQGSETVNAVISWNRITDENGDAVTDTIPPENLSEKVTLTKAAANDFCEGSFTLDLSSEEYKDGLYKIEIQLEDNALNLSDKKAVYYLVRDTKMSFPLDELSFYTSYADMDVEYNDETKYSQAFWGGGAIPTFEYLYNRRRVVSIYGTKNDLFYTYKKSGKKVDISSDADRYFITCDFGISEDDIDKENKNVELQGNQWSDSKSDFEYWYPEALLTFIEENSDANIYVRFNIMDEVGNVLATEIYFPTALPVYNYTFNQNGSDSTVKLNVADQSSLDWSNIFNLENFNVALRYRIYVAQTDAPMITQDANGNNIYNSEVIFKRNVWPQIEYYMGKTTDNFEFPVEEGKPYTVIIRPEFNFTRKADNYDGGTVSGPFTVFKIDKAQTQTAESITKPSFSVTTKNNGKNSGTVTITATLDQTTLSDGVEYKLAYSTDGENFTYLYDVLDKNSQIKSVIPTPLIAPYYSKWLGDRFDQKGTWLEQSYKTNGNYNYDDKFGHITYDWGPADPSVSPQEPYDTTVTFKIVASKGNSIVESDPKTITFNENQDNKPPYINKWKKAHDLRLTPDGKYLESMTDFAFDDEWHLKKEFTFYYTEYNTNWGNNLYVLSENEISSLPSGKGFFTSTYSRGEDIAHDNNWIDLVDENNHNILIGQYAKESNILHIPTDCFGTGEYMVFIKLEDTAGNYAVEPAGKINMASFEQKPVVTYSNSKLNINFQPENADFDDNILKIEYYDTESASAWTDLFVPNLESYNISQREYTKTGSKLTYKTDTLTAKDTFYKVYSQSRNKDLATQIYWYMDNWGNGWWTTSLDGLFSAVTDADVEARRYEGIINSVDDNDKNILRRIILADTSVDTTYVGSLRKKEQQKINDPENASGITDEEFIEFLNKYAAETTITNTELKNLIWTKIKYIIAQENIIDAAYDYYIDETTAYPVIKYVSDSTETYEDDDKNFVDGAYGAMLMCTQPALVEFISSSYDLGDSLDVWELKGKVEETQFYNDPSGLSSYTSSGLELLKSDVIKHKQGQFYYVVAVHFADGSENISRVYKK